MTMDECLHLMKALFLQFCHLMLSNDNDSALREQWTIIIFPTTHDLWSLYIV